MAASQVKVLLDELAKVLAEMGALEETAPEGEPMPEENAQKLGELAERAEKLKGRIEFHETLAKKELELRAVLERAAPAPVVEAKTEPQTQTEEKRSMPAIPKTGVKLRAFSGPDAEERAYRSGMHIRGILGDQEARRWCKDAGMEFRVQAGGVNSLGGALVAPEFSDTVIRLVEEQGAFPANARTVPMSSDTLVIARRTGGLTARPVGENVEPTASDVTFDNVELSAKIWGVANRTSNSLLEDSPISIADLMAQEVGQAFAEAYDGAGFIGDGTSTYHGVNGAANKIVGSSYTKSVITAPTGDTTFADIELRTFVDVVGRLPIYARRNAKWYISPAGYGSSMLRLAMASTAVSPSDVAGGFGLQFLGYPVVLVHPMTSDLTGTASKVAALFGDLSQAATFGDRRAISIRTSADRYMELDQTLTFCAARAAIVVHDLGSTTAAGPLVALRFAAS